MRRMYLILVSLILLTAICALTGYAEDERVTYGVLCNPGCSAKELEDMANDSDMLIMGHKTNTVYFDDFSSMRLAFESGRIDCMDAIEPVAAYYTALHPGAAYQLGTTTVRLCMAVRSGDDELLNTLNGAIDALTKDGTLKALAEQYAKSASADELPEPVDMPIFEGARTLRVVVTGDLPPLDYITADGTAVGYNTVLLTQIGKWAGMNIEIVFGNAVSRVAMLESGRADSIFWLRDYVIQDDAGDLTFEEPEASQGLLISQAYYEAPCVCVYHDQK